jgi:hypothetical protein
MTSTPQTFAQLVGIFIDLINTAMPVLAGVALLVFFWGLVKFIRNSGDVKSHTDGKNLMIWGVIGLFIMVSIWGLVRFAQSSLGIVSGPSLGIPLLPTANDSQSGYCTYPTGAIVSGSTLTQCNADHGTWSATKNF